MKNKIAFVRGLVYLSLITFLISGCNQGSKDVTGEISEINKEFMISFNSGNAAEVAAHYTMNAKLFPANSEVIEGQAAIEGFWGGAMKMGIKKAILETLTAEQIGNIVIEEGIYKLFVDGDIMVDQGKYLVTWQKEDGKWKMHRDIWNTIHPAPRAMASENDSVWIISYRIKADKVKQFEEFNFKYMLPAAAELFPQVRNSARLLRPVEPNPDGSYTYFYVMDGMKARKNYDIDMLLVARYGEEKAKEYLTMFLECLTAKGHDEVMTVQTAL